MLKCLFFIFGLFLTFNAEAYVKQSFSKALSYRNVVDDQTSVKQTKAIQQPQAIRGTLNRERVEKPVPEVIPPKEVPVDMTSSDVASVTLDKNDIVYITLTEDSNHYWKMSTSGKLEMLNNSSSDGVRVLKYKLKEKAEAYIYFDYVDSASNSIEKTKQLSITVP